MAGVPHFRFEPLGIQTSRIGFGCGTLVGRHTFKAAARLVETALDLGIRYFDTAPLYGMGTAEEVLGAVVGDNRDVVIATKVGLARPRYSALKAMVRRVAKPALDRSRPLKAMARSLYSGWTNPSGRVSAAQKSQDFSITTIQRELDESLRLLRRPCVDVYLAHDPLVTDLSLATTEAFARLAAEGRIGFFGAAVTVASSPWLPFGNVWQSGWPGSAPAYPADMGYVFHGLIRNAPKDRFGRAVVAPAAALRSALEAAPRALFLVSASTPAKLRRLVSDVIQ